jgi:hypothetical protein
MHKKIIFLFDAQFFVYSRFTFISRQRFPINLVSKIKKMREKKFEKTSQFAAVRNSSSSEMKLCEKNKKVKKNTK